MIKNQLGVVQKCCLTSILVSRLAATSHKSPTLRGPKFLIADEFMKLDSKTHLGHLKNLDEPIFSFSTWHVWLPSHCYSKSWKETNMHVFYSIGQSHDSWMKIMGIKDGRNGYYFFLSSRRPKRAEIWRLSLNGHKNCQNKTHEANSTHNPFFKTFSETWKLCTSCSKCSKKLSVNNYACRLQVKQEQEGLVWRIQG